VIQRLLSNIQRKLAALGAKGVEFVCYMGSIAIFMGDIAYALVHPPFRIREAIRQTAQIGANSIPIVSLISLFVGIVIALQSAYQMQKMSAEMYIASLVALSMIRELGPVLTALVVAGRSGAAITAEIGTMKVTEQIDALETLSANPVQYLVVPRFIAMLIMLPILTIYADFFGMLGGYLIGVGKLGITHSMYMQTTTNSLVIKDVMTGLIKSISFAVIICTIACFEGMNSGGGAEGVGKATTSSVVKSFIMIIIADCFFTALFYFMK